MSHTLREVLPFLQPIEDGRLLPDRAARVHRVVPDDAGEDEGDREFHRLGPRLLPHDNEQRRHERRVRAGHSAGAENPLVPAAGADAFLRDLRDFAQNPHDEGDQEGIEAEEGHGIVV